MQAIRCSVFREDDINLALETEADGVHIGQEDTPLAEAVALCRGRLMPGLSHNTQAELARSGRSPAVDYFAVGSVFPTCSKPDAKPVVGGEIIRQTRRSGFNRPLVGIGGINAGNAAAVRAAGADGVAVISAIAQATDIDAAVKALPAC